MCGREVAQTMHTHVSKCKNDKRRKINEYKIKFMWEEAGPTIA
jgi:hypothetical protein